MYVKTWYNLKCKIASGQRFHYLIFLALTYSTWWSANLSDNYHVITSPFTIPQFLWKCHYESKASLRFWVSRGHWSRSAVSSTKPHLHHVDRLNSPTLQVCFEFEQVCFEFWQHKVPDNSGSLLKHFRYFQGPCYSATAQMSARQWRLIFYLLSFVCFSTMTNIMTRMFPPILKRANQNRPRANTITSINSILYEPTRLALQSRIFRALCLLQTFKLSKNQATELCLHLFPIIQTCTYPCSSN